MFKHFIWDFDGTLFDSYPPMVKAFYKALSEEGIEMSEEEILLEMKKSVRHLIELTKERFGVDPAFIERFTQLRIEHEEALFEPFPGVIPVLKTIIDRGGHNHIYTHRGASTHNYLDKYGMTDLFDEVVTFENGFALKPDPEGVAHILKVQKIDPATAVLIGDRELDILSGQNGGIKGCFFSERPEFTCDRADYTISEFDQVLALVYCITDN